MKRQADRSVHIIIKAVMTVIFLWSGFFWSGVTALNYLINDTEYSYLSVQFIAGSLILLLGLILCWLRLYILQIIPSAAGLIVYLIPAREMIDHVAGTGIVFKPSFEARYLPIIGFALLSIVLFILRVCRIVLSRIEQRNEFNNRPADSILEKRQGE